MAFMAILMLVLVLAAVFLAWWVTRWFTGAAGPTEDQRRAVAENFLKGAKLMGRTSEAGKSARGKPKPASSGPDGVDIDPETDDTPPPSENLRAALGAFNTGLRSYRYDFSTRYLKAQALEDLGDLTDALKELDWLISAKSTVTHGFFRRMAIALGLLEYRTVAPMGTTLKSDCEVDLIVFHLRKRRGRVLLKKRRADEAIPELNAALKMLDNMAWKEEMNERGRIVRERMKTLRGEDIGKPGSAPSSSASTALPGAKADSKGEEGEKLLQGQGSEKLGGEGSLKRDAKGSGSQKGGGSSTFQPTFARAEISLLLGRCFEIQGSTTKALRWLHEAESLGDVKVREEAKIALKQMMENAQNGTKTE